MKGNLDCGKSIAQRNAGMGISRGIDDYKVNFFVNRSLDTIYQLSFCIALKVTSILYLLIRLSSINCG